MGCGMANTLPVVHQSCLVLCAVNICQKFDIYKCFSEDKADTCAKGPQLFDANSVHNLALSFHLPTQKPPIILFTIWPQRSIQTFDANSVHNLAFSSSHTEASNHLMQILTRIWPSYPPTGLPGSLAYILFDKEKFVLIVYS